MDQNDKFGWILNPAIAPVSGWDRLVRGILVFFVEKVKLIVRLAAALCHSKSTLISRHRNGAAIE